MTSILSAGTFTGALLAYPFGDRRTCDGLTGKTKVGLETYLGLSFFAQLGVDGVSSVLVLSSV